MRRVAIFISLILVSAIAAQAQKVSPSDTVVKFYRALKDKKYVEGFRYSVYKGAIDGLSAAELKDLEPDFARTFSEIPEKIEVKGEQISGDTAVVFLKFAGSEETQPVALLRINGEWQVGDNESLTLVQQQGRSFFFNSRMAVNEQEVATLITRIFGSELIYAQKFDGQYLNLAELVKMQAVSNDVEDGEASGYKFTMTVGSDKKSFTLTAVPNVYGKTGKLSFYLDPKGLRAEDLQGRPATDKSPLLQPKQD